MVKYQKTIEQIAGVALIAAIFIGCMLVLRPFVSAILWAGILCFATWPVHEVFLKRLGRHRNIAAGLMTLLLSLVLIIPFLMVGVTFTDTITSTLADLDSYKIPPPPAWVEHIPLIGTWANESWLDLEKGGGPAVEWLRARLKTIGLWLVNHSLSFARGVFQLIMSVLIAFFLYRDGEGLVIRLREGFQRISGDYGQHLMDVVKTTVRSVVYGVIGTGLAQGFVAGIGFTIARVPSALLLAVLTFFLSFVPVGPPIIWIGAAIWLFAQHSTGWGIFMVVYGVSAISSVDNVVKPIIISRGSKLPFIVMFIGVLGGVATFGFIGIFLGPTLLAVGYSLVQEILDKRGIASTVKPVPVPDPMSPVVVTPGPIVAPQPPDPPAEADAAPRDDKPPAS